MKFESSFLVRATQLTCSEWICLCPTVSLKALGPTKQAAVEMMSTKLEVYASTQGRRYIDGAARNLDGVCCPEGFLDLPFDIWKCKLDKQVCELQAWISVDDKEKFAAGCHAPGQRKEDIYRIVTEGVYRGAHHMPGRYLCPTCRGKPNTRYYYPWELTSLNQFVDTSSHDFRATLTENGFSLSIVSSNLCPDCFMQIISIIKPSLVDELESIQLSFSEAPDETRFRPRMKDRPGDFVASLLKSPDGSWRLGLALAALYEQEEYTPDFGDAIALAEDWLGSIDEEVTDVGSSDDESEGEQLIRTADSVAWRAGWSVLCGGLEELLRRGWKLPQ